MCHIARVSLLKINLVTGVQATVSSKDFGVGTSIGASADPFSFSSTSVKRPPKRSCLDLEEEEDQDDNRQLFSGSLTGVGCYL